MDIGQHMGKTRKFLRGRLEGVRGSGQVPSLLAERARSECARSTCAVEATLATPPKGGWKEHPLLDKRIQG
jgi:hypothetical protein